MPEALKKKMFGLPRWAWISILIAAVGIGLYLRHQRNAEEESEPTSETAPVGSYPLQEGEEGGYVVAGGGAGYGYGYEGEGEFSGESQPVEININVPEPPAPSALGPESVESGEVPPPEVTHSQSHKETSKVAATTGGGPPAKPAVNAKAAGVTGAHATPGGGVVAKSTKTGKIVGIGGAQAVGGGGGGGGGGGAGGGGGGAAAQHPNAVNTGNNCVNGGVGGHTAPPGYHLFCSGGKIWRAPNS